MLEVDLAEALERPGRERGRGARIEGIGHRDRPGGDVADGDGVTVERQIVVGAEQFNRGGRQRIGSHRHRDRIRAERIDLDRRHVVRKAVRTVHRHGKPEHAVFGCFDDDIRRRRLAVAVGDRHLGVDQLVGLRVAAFVVEDAVQLHRYRLGTDREAHRAARRRRPYRRELIDHERNLRQIRMAGERDARSVAPDGADILVARIGIDLRRVLVAGVRPAKRRMDHMRHAGDGLHDGRAARDEGLRRRNAGRAPVGCNLVKASLELRLISSEDAVDGLDGRADGKRRPLRFAASRVAGKRAGQQAHLLAVDCIDGSAMSGRDISAKRRVHEKRGISVPGQSHRTAMSGGIARKGR